MGYLERIKLLQGCLNTSEYARFLEVPQQTLNYLLKGERKLSIELLLHICEKHKVSADYILGLDSSVQNQSNFRTEQTKEENTPELAIENRLLREEIARLHSTIVAITSDLQQKKDTTQQQVGNIATGA